LSSRASGRSMAPSADLVGMLPALAKEFPGRTMAIVQGYAEPQKGLSSGSHTQGRALDLRIAGVDCDHIELFLVERSRLLARVGCFPNATLFHVDVGQSCEIWADVMSGATEGAYLRVGPWRYVHSDQRGSRPSLFRSIAARLPAQSRSKLLLPATARLDRQGLAGTR